MITRYNPNNPVIIPQIRETLKILEMDPSLGEIFKNLNFISSQRQPRNLKQIVTRANFESRDSQGGSKNVVFLVVRIV